MAGRVKFSLLGFVVILLMLIGWTCLIFFKPYRQTSGSMAVVIDAGDHVLMRRWAEPKRGDIIVFDYPLQPKTQFIKRVVALAGETVEIRDKQLFINGKKVEEIYAWHDDQHTFPRDPKLPEPYRSRDQYGPAVVPADSYFVMGDNRDRSSDSRYWGSVPRKLVRGVVVVILSKKRGLVTPLIVGSRGFVRP